MRILVDGDACPVKKQIIDLSNKYNISVIIFIDNAHEYVSDQVSVIKVDIGSDSVDHEIFIQASKDDIILTNDYGLASLILSKKAIVCDFFGMEYTNANIDTLLFSRAMNMKLRKRNIYSKGPKKRTLKDDKNFTAKLDKILSTTIYSEDK